MRFINQIIKHYFIKEENVWHRVSQVWGVTFKSKSCSERSSFLLTLEKERRAPVSRGGDMVFRHSPFDNDYCCPYWEKKRTRFNQLNVSCVFNKLMTQNKILHVNSNIRKKKQASVSKGLDIVLAFSKATKHPSVQNKCIPYLRSQGGWCLPTHRRLKVSYTQDRSPLHRRTLTHDHFIQ